MILVRSRPITATLRTNQTVLESVVWVASRTCPTSNRWNHMDSNSNNNSTTSPNNSLSVKITTGLEAINNSRVTTIKVASNNDLVISRKGRCLAAVETTTTCPSNSNSRLTIEAVVCVEVIEVELAATWAAEVAWETTTINNTWEVIRTNSVAKVSVR